MYSNEEDIGRILDDESSPSKPTYRNEDLERIFKEIDDFTCYDTVDFDKVHSDDRFLNPDYEDFGYYDGSIDRFLSKLPKEYLDNYKRAFPNYLQELEENTFYSELKTTKQTILHVIAGHFRTTNSVMAEDTEFPYELLEKKGTFYLRDSEGQTPFHLMCENADWCGIGPTRYLQTKIETYIVKKYPDFNLSETYLDCASEDKLYYKEVQDRILNYINRCNAEKFIERL